MADDGGTGASPVAAKAASLYDSAPGPAAAPATAAPAASNIGSKANALYDAAPAAPAKLFGSTSDSGLSKQSEPAPYAAPLTGEDNQPAAAQQPVVNNYNQAKPAAITPPAPYKFPDAVPPLAMGAVGLATGQPGMIAGAAQDMVAQSKSLPPPPPPAVAKPLTGSLQQNVANFPNNSAASWQGDIVNPVMQGIPAVASALTERGMQSIIPDGAQHDSLWQTAADALPFSMTGKLAPGTRPIFDAKDLGDLGHAAVAGGIDIAKQYSPVGPHGWRGGQVANNLYQHPWGVAGDAASLFMGMGGPKGASMLLKGGINAAGRSRFGLLRAIPDKLRRLQELRLGREFEGVARQLDGEAQHRLTSLYARMHKAWEQIPKAEQLQIMAHREGTETIHEMSEAAQHYLGHLENLLDETTKILTGDNALKLKVVSRVDRVLAKWGPMMQQLAAEDGTPHAIEDFKTAGGNLNPLGKQYMKRAMSRAIKQGREPGYVPHKHESAMKGEVAGMTTSSPLVELRKKIKDFNDSVHQAIIAPFTGRVHGALQAGHTMDAHLAAMGTAAQVERFKLYCSLIAAAEEIGAAHAGADIVEYPIKQALKDAYANLDQLGALPPPGAIEKMTDTIKVPKWLGEKLDNMFAPKGAIAAGNAAFDELRQMSVGRAMAWITQRYVALSLGLKPMWPALQGAQQWAFNQMGMWRINPLRPDAAAKEYTASLVANVVANDDRAKDILHAFTYSHVPGVPDRVTLADPLAKTIVDESVPLAEKYLAFERAVTAPVFNAAQAADNSARRMRAAYLIMRQSLEQPGAMADIWKNGINLDKAIGRMKQGAEALTLEGRVALTRDIDKLMGDYSKSGRYELRAVAFVLPYCQWLPHLKNAVHFMLAEAPYKTNYLRHTGAALAPELQPSTMAESEKEGGGVYRRDRNGNIMKDNRGQRQIVKQTYFNPVPVDAAVDVAKQAASLGQGSGELPRSGQAIAPWLQFPAMMAGRNPMNWRQDVYQSDAPPLAHGQAQGVNPLLAGAATFTARPWSIARDTALAMNGGMQGTSTSFNDGRLNVSRDKYGYPIRYGNAAEAGARIGLGLRYMSERKTADQERRMNTLDERDQRKFLARHPGLR